MYPSPESSAFRPERSQHSGRGLLLMMLLLTPLFGGAPPRQEVGRNHAAGWLNSLERPADHDARLDAAYSALQAKDLTKAYRLSVLAEQQGTPRRAVLPLQAEIFRAADYLDKEMASYRQWSALAPQDAVPSLKLFHIYLDLGWKREAEAASLQASARAPRNSRCYVARALLAYRSNDPAAGLPAIESAERLDPANSELTNLHASLLLKALRFPDAEKTARQALQKAPHSKGNRLVLVQALLGQNKNSEAESLLHALQQEEPDNAEVACQLGLLAEKRHDPTEATRQFERAAAGDAQYSNILWHLGRLYMQQGRTEEGRKLLKLFARMDGNASDFETLLKRLEAHPDDADLHYRLGRSHGEAEELSQAIVEFQRVLQIQPTHTAARKDLAAALARAGRTTEARALTLAHVRQ